MTKRPHARKKPPGGSRPQGIEQRGRQETSLGADGAAPASSEDLLRHFAHVFQHAKWGIAISRGNTALFELVNPAFARMHGYAVEDLAGKPILDVFPPDWHSKVLDHIRIANEQEHHVFEAEHIRKDGTVFPVDIDVSAVKDVDGNVLFRAVHVQDITERKQSERELHASEARYRNVYNHTPVMMHSIDREGRLIRVNDHWLATLGYEREEVLGCRGPDFLTPESRKRAYEVILPELFVRGCLNDVEIQMVKKSGEVLEVILSAVVEKDPEYGSEHTLAFLLDVTEKKRAEEARRRTERRLERILESAMDAIIAVDDGLVVRHCNAAAEDVFGCSAADLIGQSFERFASVELKQLLQSCMRAFGRSGARKRYLWTPEGLKAVRQNGELFPIEATISHAGDEDERLYTIILRDVNERLRAEEDLRRLRIENVYLREEIGAHYHPDDLVCVSTGFRRVLDAVASVSATDTTVLITGETGTGKEMVARAIHNQSRRKDGPLIIVNCAGLPSGLIESELFGHEAGAFTGAVSRRIGRFEMANGGTIFLDEIGDLPIELQAKLLRVLQEGEFERVGSTETLRVDARVIAATNADLEKAVEAQRFRSDLFYRLNVFPVQIPPLRERRADIPALVRHFVMKHATRMGKRIDSIPRATMETLMSYAWPGNARELQNIVERGVILTSGRELTLGDWLPRLAAKPGGGRIPTLEEFESLHILEALQLTGWRVSGERGAAKLLGMKPTTLETRMKRLGIERPQQRASGSKGFPADQR